MKKGLLSILASLALAVSFATPPALAAGHYGGGGGGMGGGGGEEGGETTLGNNLSAPTIFVGDTASAPALRVACPNPGQPPQGPRAGGYWEAASDGGVFNFGSASFFGSMGAKHLNKPVVGIAAPKNSQGYWLVAADGGVFNFNVPFYGSTGNRALNAPVVGMVVDQATGGYWLVASDGGVFNFNAPFFGSTGDRHLNKPVVGMTATPDGQGYTLVAADGGVFNFGDSAFYGSMGGEVLDSPIVGMQPTPSGQGYTMTSATGTVFTFGDAAFYGDMSGVELNKPVVGIAHYPGFYLQKTEATWSATCTTADSATVTANWGDNLTSAARADRQNRVEVALTDTTDAAATGGTGYPITNLTPNLEDRNATYGTDGTSRLADGLNMVTDVWAPGATLTIKPTPGGAAIYDGPISAEINSSGSVVYGYNWPATAAGTYTLTFTIPSGITISKSNGSSFDATTTTLDVTLRASGGGGGGEGE